MSVRRDTNNRLTLFRDCQTCGRRIVTSAASPLMRQMTNVGGKKQKTCYFCSEACKKASYKHLFDGKADQRRKAREASRDVREKNRRYYVAHAEQERQRARKRYWADHEASLANLAYQRKKKKLMEAAVWNT